MHFRSTPQKTFIKPMEMKPLWGAKFIGFGKFYQRFSNIVKKLNFSKISLKQNYDEAADLILTDRKHLDNNPKQVSKQDIISLLEKIQL